MCFETDESIWKSEVLWTAINACCSVAAAIILARYTNATIKLLKATQDGVRTAKDQLEQAKRDAAAERRRDELSAEPKFILQGGHIWTHAFDTNVTNVGASVYDLRAETSIPESTAEIYSKRNLEAGANTVVRVNAPILPDRMHSHFTLTIHYKTRMEMIGARSFKITWAGAVTDWEEDEAAAVLRPRGR